MNPLLMEKELEDGLDDLYLYNVNTKVTIMITSSPDNFEWSYSFSPDSKKILYIDEFGINEMNLDGSENRLLMAGGSSPCYSPDGSKIAFTDEKKLYLMNVDGTNKTQIVDTDIGLGILPGQKMVQILHAVRIAVYVLLIWKAI